MKYTEWVLQNWKQSATYGRAKDFVERIEAEISNLEIAIASAERYEIPVGHEGFFGIKTGSTQWADISELTSRIMENSIVALLGADEQQYKLDKWEREALEAEQRRKEQFDGFLRMYRDGRPFFSEGELWPGSLPYLRNELEKGKADLANSKPIAVYDWHGDGMISDEGYEKSKLVLEDMLDCLGMSTHWDFNDNFANKLDSLSDMGFSFKIWLVDGGFCTCSVSEHERVPKKQIIRRDYNIWSAVLMCLLDFIDTYWEELIATRESIEEDY